MENSELNRPGRPPGILLAEGSPLVRRVLDLALRGEGFAVWVAGDGDEAVQAYARHAGEVDLVLLDGCLPGPGAAGTLRALRRLNPALRCCLLGEPTTPDPDGELPELGAPVVLNKPFGPHELLPVLWRMLGRPSEGLPVEERLPSPCPGAGRGRGGPAPGRASVRTRHGKASPQPRTGEARCVSPT